MPSESNTPWQTYRNNFYTLQYPAYYQIAQEDKIKGEVTLQNNNLPLVFISSGEKTLIFKENWQVVSPEQAATAKLLATEISIPTACAIKKYWALNQNSDGTWQVAIVYYGCHQRSTLFSLLHGLTVSGLPLGKKKTVIN